MDQWKEKPPNKLLYNGQMIFNKGSQDHQERMFFSTNAVGKNRYLHMKKMRLEPYLIPYITINSNRLKV